MIFVCVDDACGAVYVTYIACLCVPPLGKQQLKTPQPPHHKLALPPLPFPSPSTAGPLYTTPITAAAKP